MTSVHQKTLGEKLQCSFVNLEEKNCDVPENGVRHLVLKPSGQIMHPGNKETKATILLRHRASHFDLLEVCQQNDRNAAYVWDLGPQPTYFRLYCVSKDHACGWSSTARALNLAGVVVPAHLQAPTEE